MAASAVPALAAHVPGLDDFVRELRRLDGNWDKELRAANTEVADEVAEWGRQELARDSHPTQRHVARLKAVRAKSDGRRAVVQVNARSRANAMAIGAVVGSKRYRQFPRYEQVRWPGGLPVGGAGPYDAIRDRIDDIRDTYRDRVDDIARRAFPH